jgi:hypothetical protein
MLGTVYPNSGGKAYSGTAGATIAPIVSGTLAEVRKWGNNNNRRDQKMALHKKDQLMQYVIAGSWTAE